jgi:diguanylate cyclase (GGDEF)-like protein
MRQLLLDPVAKHLFTEAQEGIAVFDASGTLIAWNAAARAITGWDESAAAKQDLLAKGAGMLEIREGKWVDLRKGALATDLGELRLVLFADATTQVALTEARRQLTDAGLFDRVTKLAGRSIAVGHLERSVALGRRDSRAVGAISIGVDIPRVGEAVFMDEVIHQVAKRIIATTRTSDLAARLADAELLIVLTAMANAEDAAIVAVRLLLQLSRPYVLQGRERSATVSLGVSSFPTNGDSAEEVLSAARKAMVRMRSEGGGYKLATAES